ncbi:hypothetical protein [Brevibacillus nitrificans]|uniref:hypothetical protein n=1 Tax=Brevibacillus nitrificans TaxID=651560 RepID=UPI002861A42F|nr:hypothetical protein [Brevibacillus nitrificans]MDR7316052.1 hypothetical protein [Brevibacillus nitrificans]
MDIDHFFSCHDQLTDEIGKGIDKEEHEYKKLILARLASTQRAIQILVKNQCIVEVPVLQRVTLEHVTRLAYYTKFPDKMILERIQFLDKGFNVSAALDALGEEYRSIYSLISAFSHADTMAMFFNTNDSDMNSALLVHLICMFETVNLLIYKESYNNDNLEEARGSFLAFHSSLGTMISIIQAFVEASGEGEIKQLPDLLRLLVAPKSFIGKQFETTSFPVSKEEMLGRIDDLLSQVADLSLFDSKKK